MPKLPVHHCETHNVHHSTFRLHLELYSGQNARCANEGEEQGERTRVIIFARANIDLESWHGAA